MSNFNKLHSFLNKNSLSQYIPLFERHSITYEDLSYIKEHHITSYIGIPVLHDHIRLMNEINKLQSMKNQYSNKEVAVFFNGDTFKINTFITKTTCLKDIFNEVKGALLIKSKVNDYVFRRGLVLFSYSYSLFYDEDCLFTNGRYEFELISITQLHKETREAKVNQSYTNKESKEIHKNSSSINNSKSSLTQKSKLIELNSKEKEDFSFYTLGINKRKEDYLKTSRSNKKTSIKPQKNNKKKRKIEEDSNEINENNNAFDNQETQKYSPSLKSSKSLTGKDNNNNPKVTMINLTEESYMLYFNNRKKGYFDKLNNYYIEAKKIRPTRKGDESSSKEEGDGQMKDLLQSNSIDNYEYLNLNTDSKLKAYVNESKKNKNLYMNKKKKSEQKRLCSSFLLDEK